MTMPLETYEDSDENYDVNCPVTDEAPDDESSGTGEDEMGDE